VTEVVDKAVRRPRPKWDSSQLWFAWLAISRIEQVTRIDRQSDCYTAYFACI